MVLVAVGTVAIAVASAGAAVPPLVALGTAVGTGGGAVAAGAAVAGIPVIVTGPSVGAAFVACAATGPPGWIAGAMLGAAEGGVSWDCWKPVLHDNSTVLSSGIMMEKVFADARVRKVSVDADKLVIRNIWEEEFIITFHDIKGHGIAAHAIKM